MEWGTILLLSGTLHTPVSLASHGRMKAVHCLQYLDGESLGSVSVVSSCWHDLSDSLVGAKAQYSPAAADALRRHKSSGNPRGNLNKWGREE